MRGRRLLRSLTLMAAAVLVIVVPATVEARVVSQFPTLTASTISFGLRAPG